MFSLSEFTGRWKQKQQPTKQKQHALKDQCLQNVEIGHYYADEEEEKKKTAWGGRREGRGEGGSERRDGSRCRGDV